MPQRSFLDIELAVARAEPKHQADLVPPKEPREFTAEERECMAAVNSVEGHEPLNALYKEHLAVRVTQKRGMIWFFVVAVGVAVGFTGILMVTIMHILSAIKHNLLLYGLSGYQLSARGSSGWNALQGESPGLVGEEQHNLFAGYIMWISFSIICAGIVTGCTMLVPSSVGLGAPEVVAFLNGVESIGSFNVKNLLAKITSAIFAVASGLPLGYFGTVIHCGTMLSSVFLSPNLAQLAPFHFFSNFRNERDRRVIIIMGAAAGVASAFTVSVGGLLFIMEHLTTGMPVRMALYVFVCCLITAFVTQLYFSYFTFFDTRDRGFLKSSFGELLFDALVKFNVRHGFKLGLVPMNIFNFLPAVLIGFVCGGLSIAFIQVQWWSIRLRRWISIHSFNKFPYFEPIIITFLYGTTIYWVSAAFRAGPTTDPPYHCENVPKPLMIARNFSVTGIYSASGSFCDPETTGPIMHPFSSLAMGFPDSTLQMLLSWKTETTFSAGLLIAYFLIYFVGSAMTVGVALSGDALLPLLVIGAMAGRLIGLGVHATAMSASSAAVWADPGVFAVIGAGSFFAASTGVSFTACVIMVEMTNDFQHIVALMVAITIAKLVSDKFSYSLTSSYLQVRCIPMLDFSLQVEKFDMFSAKHIMAKNLVTLSSMETIQTIMHILKSHSHNAFPVLTRSLHRFRGLVIRSQLHAVLWNIYETGSFDPMTYDEMQQVVDQHLLANNLEDMPPFSPAVVDTIIDLTKYIDRSTFCVQESCSISRTYNLFKSMGLRHLAVLNKECSIIGIITRKDLTSDHMVERLIEENDRRFLRVIRKSNDRPQDQDIAALEDAQRNFASTNRLSRIRSWLVQLDDDEDDKSGAGGSGSNLEDVSVSQFAVMHPKDESIPRFREEVGPLKRGPGSPVLASPTQFASSPKKEDKKKGPATIQPPKRSKKSGKEEAEEGMLREAEGSPERKKEQEDQKEPLQQQAKGQKKVQLPPQGEQLSEQGQWKSVGAQEEGDISPASEGSEGKKKKRKEKRESMGQEQVDVLEKEESKPPKQPEPPLQQDQEAVSRKEPQKGSSPGAQDQRAVAATEAEILPASEGSEDKKKKRKEKRESGE